MAKAAQHELKHLRSDVAEVELEMVHAQLYVDDVKNKNAELNYALRHVLTALLWCAVSCNSRSSSTGDGALAVTRRRSREGASRV